MLFRTLASLLLMIIAILPASAANLGTPGDSFLGNAAARMKLKDYSGARQAALKASANGPRALLLGMSALRLEHWEEAAGQLASAADNYPLLADYALYNQGVALSRLSRHDQALQPLYKLLKQFPDSRLARPATLLYADSLAAAGYPSQALESYTIFLERYPSGSDSLSALFNSAACREKLGDATSAAAIYRKLWLDHPTASVADKAALELSRLSAAGIKVQPYTGLELYRRAVTLYDLGRYSQAAKSLSEVPLVGENAEFATRVRLKNGQALLKAKRPQEAEETLRGIGAEAGGLASEAAYWLAKALDKGGKTEQACELLLRLAQTSGPLADDALLDAAYLKRQHKKTDEALQLYQRYLAGHPDPQKAGSALWDAAWTCWQNRDYQGAAAYLKKLSGNSDLREKALYWQAKSLANLGDSAGAQQLFPTLGAEFPFGYYSLICNKWCDVSAFPSPPRSLSEALPMPAGFEREKALIALGLFDEAAKELAAKKAKNPLGIARLYLEMENFNGALHAVAKESKRLEKEGAVLWGLNYPLAYREEVVRNSQATAVPQTLIWAIMRTESNYSPSALSSAGAVGLMQIMPATAESMSKGDSVRLTRPELNIRLGSRYLKDQLATYNGSIALTAAAYNAGPGNVKKWQKNFGSLPLDEFVESIPFRETREYVKKVVSAMELYQRLYRMQAEKKTLEGKL